MGVFDFLRKKKANKEIKAEQAVLEQDLTIEEQCGHIFSFQMLFEEPCVLPDQKFFCAVMEKHLGSIDCFCYKDGIAGIAAKKYSKEIDGKNVPPFLNIAMGEIEPEKQFDIMVTSQMWDCSADDKKRILERCRYQIIATDMLSHALDRFERTEMLMDYLEALLELFPSCAGIYFMSSAKIILASLVAKKDVPREHRFIHYAVNRRFFNVSGTEDMVVDTQGMSIIGLPDLQYHFHDVDPNQIICHALNTIIYIFGNDEHHIKPGDTIDGITDGIIDSAKQWKCQYEDSLIQPLRMVIDINIGENASGNRE